MAKCIWNNQDLSSLSTETFENGLRTGPDVLNVTNQDRGKVHEDDLLKAVQKFDYVRLSFIFELPEGKKIVWESVLHKSTLYVQISALILPKEGFVSLLDFAEEVLGCTQVIASMKKDRIDFSMLLRSFMFLGFTPLPPGHPLVPRNSDPNNFFMDKLDNLLTSWRGSLLDELSIDKTIEDFIGKIVRRKF